MTTLHLITSSEGLTAALEVAGPDDGLLLMGEASMLSVSVGERTASILEEDFPKGAKPAAHVTLIDYARFVDLVAEHQPIITWR